MKRIITGMVLLLASAFTSAASVTISNPTAVTGASNFPVSLTSFATTDTSAVATFIGLDTLQSFAVEMDVLTSATGTLSFDISTTVDEWTVSILNTSTNVATVLGSWWSGGLFGGFTGLTSEVEAGTVYKLLVFGDESWDGNAGRDITVSLSNIELSEVPLPAAVWLFGSVLLGGLAMRRKKRLAAVA